MVEGRKLQLAGGSTYLVSLPKRWVRDAGLQPGDTLFVGPAADGSVSVRAAREERPPLRAKTFEQRPDVPSEHLRRRLIGAYLSGFGQVEVRFGAAEGPAVRRAARDFCRYVVGPEVIEESETTLVVQDLSRGSELSPEKCLRRMHRLVRTMLEDSTRALQQRNAGLALEVAQRGPDVERLYWMAAKCSLTPGASPDGLDRPELPRVWAHALTAKALERIGYHDARIAGTFPPLCGRNELEPGIGAALGVASTSAVSLLDRAVRALATGDLDEANGAIDGRAGHQRLVDDLLRRAARRRGEELLALGVVLDSLGRIAGYASDIAEQAITLSVLDEPPSR